MAQGSFRTAIKELSPPWLSTGAAEKILGVFGISLDLLAQKLTDGMLMHIPTKADASALPFLGLDRGLSKGPNESNAAFALRLRSSYDDAKRAGSARGVASQLRGYFSPLSPTMRFVDRTGNWYTWTSDMDPNVTPPSVTHGVPPNIDSSGGPYVPRSSDATGFEWWNYWLVIYSSGAQAWATRGSKWGAAGSKWGAGNAWGFAQPRATFDGIRRIVQARQPAHAWCRAIIVVIGAENTTLDPTGTLGTDGSWGNPSKLSGGVVVPSRPTNISYLDGTNNINVRTTFSTTPGIVAPTDPLLPR